MSDDVPQWAYLRREELRQNGEFVGDTFARYIAAHEEPPVDPLLIEARKLVAESDRIEYSSGVAQETLNGGHDSSPSIDIALRALRRGMELAREQPHAS